MKKILFIIRDFKQGGIPRCLQSLLAYINPEDYVVDLLCLHQDGPYKNNMPNCNVIPQNKTLFYLLGFSKNLSIIKNPITYGYKIYNRLSERFWGSSLLKTTLGKIGNQLSNQYDTVIAYSEGIAAQVASEINCKNRYVWIHNDYAFDCARGDQGTSFEKFTRIICVSQATKNSFLDKFPQYKTKTIVIYNIINGNFILESANDGISPEFHEKFYNIVSVGRICYQKNFIIIPSIIASLPIDVKAKIRWFILGDGPENEVTVLRDKITEYGLENQCIILGNRDNPYPYIKNADLFVLTSNYESYPTVVNEALVLETPVISIDIPPVHEMIAESQIYPLEKLSEAIISIVNNDYVISNFCEFQEHNNTIVKKIKQLLN